LGFITDAFRIYNVGSNVMTLNFLPSKYDPEIIW